MLRALLAVLLVSAALAPARAQQPPRSVRIAELLAEGFELKAVGADGALYLQKGPRLYVCSWSPLIQSKTGCYCIE